MDMWTGASPGCFVGQWVFYKRDEASPKTKKETPALERTEQEIPKRRAFLSYIKNVTDHIGKILGRYDVETIYKPTETIQQCLRSAKTEGTLYRIPCTCGSVYYRNNKKKYQHAGDGAQEKLPIGTR